MTTAIVYLFSGLLIGVILGVELWRGRVPGHFDFLRTISAIYLLSYGLAPLYLQVEDPSFFREGPWSWVLRTPFGDSVFAEASVLAFLGYAFLVGGYWLTAPRRRRVDNAPVARPAYLWVAGTLLGVVGILSLIVYATSVGGWTVFLVQALAFRGGNPPVVSQWAFLTNIAPCSIGAMIVFLALRQLGRSTFGRVAATFLLSVCFFASLTILFHQAGRAAFVAFLLTVPLIGIVQEDRIRLRNVLWGGALLVGLLVFGKAFFLLLKSPSLVLGSAAAPTGVFVLFREFMREFTFPIVTLANLIRSVPERIGWRWFYDFPLALAYLVPQRLTGVVHEATVSQLNTLMFRADGGVPVDLVSLGYVSLFVPGVILTAGGLGALAGVAERLVPASRDPVKAGLRVTWLFTLALRVMYADPQLFWRSGFYVLILTVVVMLPRWMRGVLSPRVISPNSHLAIGVQK